MKREKKRKKEKEEEKENVRFAPPRNSMVPTLLIFFVFLIFLTELILFPSSFPFLFFPLFLFPLFPPPFLGVASFQIRSRISVSRSASPCIS